MRCLSTRRSFFYRLLYAEYYAVRQSFPHVYCSKIYMFIILLHGYQMEDSMKRKIFAAVLCLALLLSMMPVSVFAEDSEPLSQGLYWRRTQRGQNESGDMVFEPVGDPSNEPIVGEPNNDAIREFVYVDETGKQSTVRFAELHFSGSCYEPDAMPSKNDDPDSGESEWSLVSFSFTEIGSGTVTYGEYSISVICQAPDYEFCAYDIDAGKAGDPIEHWDWTEDNNTICFVANNGHFIRSFEENTGSELHSSHLGPVIKPEGGSFPTTLVTITLEDEPQEKELEILFNGNSNSITIRVSGLAAEESGLFWRAADSTEWTKDTITGQCGHNNRFKFVFRAENGEQTLLKEDFSIIGTFFECETDGPGVNFDFTTAGSGELIYTTGGTEYKIAIVVDHIPADPVTENEVAATCKDTGSYDEVVYCEGCDEELSREEKTIDKLTEHTWGEWVKNEAGTEQARTCAVCGETETEAIPDSGNSGNGGNGSHSGGHTSGEEEPAVEPETPAEEPQQEMVTVEVKDPQTGESVEVEVTKKAAEAAEKFTDVGPTDYFAEAVGYAVEKGITAGVTEDTFGPAQDCTRAQVVTFLWVACGQEAPNGADPFTDTQGDAYYADAVAWAVENGITAGTSEDAFSPERTVTRGQFITMLWIAQGKPKADGAVKFSDVPADAYYAEAVAWAFENNITAGTSEDTFSPDAPCTRGQIVTFLYNAFK